MYYGVSQQNVNKCGRELLGSEVRKISNLYLVELKTNLNLDLDTSFVKIGKILTELRSLEVKFTH